MEHYHHSPYVVAQASQEARSKFIKNTYLHLAGAVLGFALVEFFLINFTNLGPAMLQFLSKSSYMWFVVLGGFMGVSFIAQRLADASSSKASQYAGLSLFVVGESIVILPLLFMASLKANNAIAQAAIATGGLFMALTVIAFTTKKDFSFLGGMIKVGFIVALALIGASMLFGFNLGIWFSGAMILLTAGSILYSTSNIIHEYSEDQYVAAAIGLFASLATLFWYILSILMNRD